MLQADLLIFNLKIGDISPSIMLVKYLCIFSCTIGALFHFGPFFFCPRLLLATHLLPEYRVCSCVLGKDLS